MPPIRPAGASTRRHSAPPPDRARYPAAARPADPHTPHRTAPSTAPATSSRRRHGSTAPAFLWSSCARAPFFERRHGGGIRRRFQGGLIAVALAPRLPWPHHVEPELAAAEDGDG